MSRTNIERSERERGDHEDDGRPRGESCEDVGSGARSECGLRALSAEGAGEVGGTALLKENDANEEQADDDVDGDDEVEKNLHC